MKITEVIRRLFRSASDSEMKTTLKQIQGCILGGAIGDALGSQTEFHRNDGTEHITDLGPTWGYQWPAFSDDTQNALAIAEALLTYRPNDDGMDQIDLFMEEVAKNFVKWADDDPRWGVNDRSPGGTCMSGTRALACGTPWTKSGSVAGKGNGSSMRAWPVGCAYYDDPILGFQMGAMTAIPTHNNLESLLAAGAVAYLVANAIRGLKWGANVAAMCRLIENWKAELPLYTMGGGADPEWALGRLSSAYTLGNSDMTEMEWKNFNGNDGKAIESVAAAIFYNTRCHRYEDVIIGCANYTKDSDSTACIAGAIAGARWGIDCIRKDWQTRIEKSAYLFDIAKRLYNSVELENERVA